MSYLSYVVRHMVAPSYGGPDNQPWGHTPWVIADRCGTCCKNSQDPCHCTWVSSIPDIIQIDEQCPLAGICQRGNPRLPLIAWSAEHQGGWLWCSYWLISLEQLSLVNQTPLLIPKCCLLFIDKLDRLCPPAINVFLQLLCLDDGVGLYPPDC